MPTLTCNGPAAPAPGEPLDQTTVTYAWSITLAQGDSRIPAMDMLMERARDVVSGRVKIVQNALQLQNPRTRAYGAAAKARWGTVENCTADVNRRKKWEFRSIIDLAASINAAYNTLACKYVKVCKDRGIDPDDHAGVTWEFGGYMIKLYVR